MVRYRKYRLEHCVRSVVRGMVDMHQQHGSLEEEKDDEARATAVKVRALGDAVVSIVLTTGCSTFILLF